MSRFRAHLKPRQCIYTEVMSALMSSIVRKNGQCVRNGTITHPLPEVEGDFQFEKEVPVAPEFGDFFLM